MGVCDIAGELLPGRKRESQRTDLTTDGSDGHGYGTAGGNQRDDSREFLEGRSQAGLQMDAEKLSAIRSANAASGSLENSSSVLISEISGKKSSSALDSRPSPLDSTHGLRAGEFFAVKDVSFELRRGELRTLGRSEKEISEKCLGATKVPDSGRRRHQCLGLIVHNGAGNQAAGQPLGRLPKAARRVNRDLGKVEKDCRQAAPKEKQIGQSANQTPWEARINMTLLKILNGLIKPDAGSITMRGRVGALIALGVGFNPILTGREPEGWEACRTSNRRLAQRVQRRRGGANQNIYINGSVLGLTKKEIDEKIDEIIDFAEIREFIDMPVQSYSSGMTVRLV